MRTGAPNPFDGAPVRILAPLADIDRAGESGVVFEPIDATLGHAGLPQSATGQAVIYTGDDAIAVAGGHREGLPTRAVAQLLLRRSFLARAREEGKSAAFLNAYDRDRAARLTRMVREAEGGERPAAEKRPHRLSRPSASTLAALARGGDLRTLDDAREGRAATFDLTGEVLRSYGVEAPRRSLRDAARVVAASAAELDLALFETFLTDKAGHAQDMAWARHEIVRLEAFLEALFASIDPARQLVIVTSDHGNLEDLSTRSHTRARVPLMAYGAGAAEAVAGARSLLDVSRIVLSVAG
jgi:hypothetical protein